MCGIFSDGSIGLIARTSPAIQSSPRASPCSSPRVANNCIPTQIPRNGLPLSITASTRAASIPEIFASPPRQSAKAPTPGNTTRSARRTTSGSSVTQIAPWKPSVSRAARSKAFTAELEVSRAVIDNRCRQTRDSSLGTTGVGGGGGGGGGAGMAPRQLRKNISSASSTFSPTTTASSL